MTQQKLPKDLCESNLFKNHNSSLSIFPNEILSLIFLNLDIYNLLVVCNVSMRFKEIGIICFVKKLRESSSSASALNRNRHHNNDYIGLSLGFEQEYKYRYNIEFEFDSYDKLSGFLKFKPRNTNNNRPMSFTQSSVVRNPSLFRATLFGSGLNQNPYDRQRQHVTTLTNTSTAIATATNVITPRLVAGSNRTNHHSNNHNNNNNHHHNHNYDFSQHNFLQRSATSLTIKSQSKELIKAHHANRIGNGVDNLKVPYKFSYSVFDNPPPSMIRNHSGERWVVPISFECPLEFFYLHEPTIIKMALSHLKIKNHHHHHNNHQSHNHVHPNNNDNVRKGLSDISNVSHDNDNNNNGSKNKESDYNKNNYSSNNNNNNQIQDHDHLHNHQIQQQQQRRRRQQRQQQEQRNPTNLFKIEIITSSESNHWGARRIVL